MESDRDTIRSRLLELAKDHRPVSPERPRGREITGVAGWVQQLYDQIVQWREAGWSWDTIVALLDKAAVPLNNKKWDARALRSEMTREKQRRAKRIAKASEKPDGGIAAIVAGQTGGGEKSAPPEAVRREEESAPDRGASEPPRRGMTLTPPWMPPRGQLPPRGGN